MTREEYEEKILQNLMYDGLDEDEIEEAKQNDEEPTMTEDDAKELLIDFKDDIDKAFTEQLDFDVLADRIRLASEE